MPSTELSDNIFNSDTLDTLKGFAENTITKCITLVEEYRKMQHEVIVTKVLEFLKSNYNRDIGLNEVAKIVFLSPSYVNSIFKSVTSYTIYEYVTKIRMENAVSLLMDSSSKIQDIANQVGYNNTQNFFRLFKKHYNMTPIEYRRKS